mgnify:CR=1 FL=1
MPRRPESKAEKGFKAKFCQYGASCKCKGTGRCKKDHSKSRDQFYKELDAITVKERKAGVNSESSDA